MAWLSFSMQRNPLARATSRLDVYDLAGASRVCHRYPQLDSCMARTGDVDAKGTSAKAVAVAIEPGVNGAGDNEANALVR